MPGPAANQLSRLRQAELAALAAVVEQQVRQLAATVDVRDVDGWWRRVAEELLTLVAALFAAARATGSRYLRRHAALEGATVEPVPVPWSTERAATSLRVSGPVAFKRHVLTFGDEAGARRAMATTLSGSAQRLALSGERDTVAATVRDSGAIVGWRRQTDADPCFFCAMLASRGSVYKSGATAGDPGFGGAAFHDHDQCVAVPLYEREEEPPEVERLAELWRQVTAGHSGKAAIREWRRWWDDNRGTVVLEGTREPEQVEPPPRPEPAVVEPPEPARDVVKVHRNVREPLVAEFGRQAQLAPASGRRLEGVHTGGDFGSRHRSASAYYTTQGPDRYEVHMHSGWGGIGLLEDSTRKAIDSGWFTPTGTEPVRSVFAHEYGHHITRTMFSDSGIINRAGAQRLLETVRDQLGIPMDVTHADRDPITTMGTLMARLNAATQGHPRVALEVSQYAASDAWELLAEVWQEYSTMGSQARPHIRAIGEVMRDLAEEAS